MRSGPAIDIPGERPAEFSARPCVFRESSHAPLVRLQLEPGVPLPSPALLKRKIIIKNKKKHAHHRSGKESDKALAAATATAAATPGTSTAPASAGTQGNGEIPRPQLEKEESKDSMAEEEDAIIQGGDELRRAMIKTNAAISGSPPTAGEELEVGSESDDEDESSSFSNLSPEEMKARERANKDKGTAGKETEAGAEISALVNYVQPIHFHSFEHAERTSCPARSRPGTMHSCPSVVCPCAQDATAATKCRRSSRPSRPPCSRSTPSSSSTTTSAR